jgi:hypothetical protein
VESFFIRKGNSNQVFKVNEKYFLKDKNQVIKRASIIIASFDVK